MLQIPVFAKWVNNVPQQYLQKESSLIECLRFYMLWESSLLGFFFFFHWESSLFCFVFSLRKFLVLLLLFFFHWEVLFFFFFNANKSQCKTYKTGMGHNQSISWHNCHVRWGIYCSSRSRNFEALVVKRCISQMWLTFSFLLDVINTGNIGLWRCFCSVRNRKKCDVHPHITCVSQVMWGRTLSCNSSTSFEKKLHLQWIASLSFLGVSR